MNIVKQIILPTVVLMIIAGLISGVLAFTYEATGIAHIDTGLTTEQLAELQPTVLPEGGTLTKVETTLEDPSLIAVYSDGSNGVALHISTIGYAGKSSPIEALVGIAADGTVTGVAVTASAETPGLGTKIEAPDYLAAFVGVSGTAESVDTITSATISSKALRDGVTAALQLFEQIKGEVF